MLFDSWNCLNIYSTLEINSIVICKKLLLQFPSWLMIFFEFKNILSLWTVYEIISSKQRTAILDSNEPSENETYDKNNQAQNSTEWLELGLGRKLYLPPLERLGSFSRKILEVRSLISSVEGLSCCRNGGFCVGLHAVSISVIDSDICLELSLSLRSVAVSTS